MTAGPAAVGSLLDSGVRFDAVFGLNDAIALGALHELLVRGIKVPDDVAVAGFDDIDEARFASPSLTTVSPGMEEIAERSIKLLIDRIEGVESAAERTPRRGGFRTEGAGLGARKVRAWPQRPCREPERA